MGDCGDVSPPRKSLGQGISETTTRNCSFSLALDVAESSSKIAAENEFCPAAIAVAGATFFARIEYSPLAVLCTERLKSFGDGAELEASSFRILSVISDSPWREAKIVRMEVDGQSLSPSRQAAATERAARDIALQRLRISAGINSALSFSGVELRAEPPACQLCQLSQDVRLGDQADQALRMKEYAVKLVESGMCFT